MAEATQPVSVPHIGGQTVPQHDLLRGFIAENAVRFPQLKGRLLVIDQQSNTYYTGEDGPEPQRMGFSSPEEFGGYLSARFPPHELRGVSYADYDDRLNLFVIRLNLPERDEKTTLAVLDHEVAHLTINDAWYRGTPGSIDLNRINLAESIAMSYALIRHYQRYGTDNDDGEQMVLQNTFHLLSARADTVYPTTHYSAPVLAEIVKNKNRIDFKNMTPEQTVELARRAAIAHVVPATAIGDIKEAFKAFGAARSKGVTLAKQARILTGVLLKTHSPHVFQAGREVLNWYLDDKAAGTNGPTRLRGTFWAAVRQGLEQKEKQFAEEGVFSGMPVKAPRL